MIEKAKEILYKYCGDKNINDGESLYYLAGQEEKILDAIMEALKISPNSVLSDSCLHCKTPISGKGYCSIECAEKDMK